MTAKIAWLLCLAALAWPGSALAGRLVIQVEASAALRDGRLAMNLVVRNQGDEPAFSLQARALAPAGAVASRLVERLDPGRSLELALTWPALALAPGRHAAVARVDFADANDYPFSALAHAYFHQGRDQPSPLAARAETVELAGEGELGLVVRNPEPRPFRLEVLAYGPKELDLKPFRQELELAARGQAELAFAVGNFSGLPGAVYPVLVVLNSQVRGLHTAKVVETRVRLRAEANLFSRYLWLWLALLAGLAALLVAMQVRSWRRRS